MRKLKMKLFYGQLQDRPGEESNDSWLALILIVNPVLMRTDCRAA